MPTAPRHIEHAARHRLADVPGETLPLWSSDPEVPTVSSITGLSRTAVYTAAREGTLPVVRFGGRVVMTVTEAAAVRWLLDQIDAYGVHVPQREDPETEAARMTDWGMGCGGSGWTHVAMARLWEYGTGDADPTTPDPLTDPDQPHPFRPGGLFGGPWPWCWPRLLWSWYRFTLPPP